MYLGGVDSLDQLTQRAWQATSADFVGCMRQITINGQNLDIQSAIRSKDVTEGCDRQPTICDSTTCGDRGTCVDEWWDSWCHCQNGATGETCDQGMTVQFSKSGFILDHLTLLTFLFIPCTMFKLFFNLPDSSLPCISQINDLVKTIFPAIIL